MKTKLFDLKGIQTGEIDLPPLFNFPYRPEIIKKAFVNIVHRFQNRVDIQPRAELLARIWNTVSIARLEGQKVKDFPFWSGSRSSMCRKADCTSA